MSALIPGSVTEDEGDAETLDWSLSGISHVSNGPGGPTGIPGINKHYLPSEMSSGRSSNLVSPDISAILSQNDSGKSTRMDFQ